MKLNLSNITSGYGAVAALNANFDAIETAVEKTLSRDGTTPNEMLANLDMNGNDILNANAVDVSSLTINGTPVQPSTGVTVAQAFQSYTFTATLGQTSFSVSPYTPYVASVQVEVNGLSLPPADISVSGTNVVIPACSAGDEVVIRRYTDAPSPFPVADDITFTPAGTINTRSVQSKLRDVVSVKDFGAVGDGIANDRAAIQAAFNASKSVYFPSGTYYLGAFSTAENIIDLSALGAGISVNCDNGVELVMQTTASVMPRVFYLLNNTNFSCDPIRIRDTGYNPLLTWKGAIGFYLDCGASDNWGDVKIDAIYGKTLVACVQVTGGNVTNRVRGINIGQLFSDDCYYGFNALNNGDSVTIDNLVAFQNFRPYFVYGCSDHKVKIFNRSARSGSGPVNISRAVGGLNTSGIDVTYVARDMTVGITHVLINHIDLLGGEISNIRLNLDIRSSVVYTPLRFVNYTGAGGSETSAASSNLVYDVTVAGSCDVQANAVTSVASYASKRQLNFLPGTNFFYDTNIPTLFSLDRQGRSQAVTWTASVTNPVLNNGSLLGSYDLVAGLCSYSVALTAGSTTTFGTGDWSFSAPFAASVTSMGSVWALDNGTAYYIGTCIINNGTSTVQCYANAAASGYRSTVPMTWATGDQLQLTITYPVS